jgi:hypothetical protein
MSTGRQVWVIKSLIAFLTSPIDTGKRPSFTLVRLAVSPKKVNFRLDFLGWSGKTRSLDKRSYPFFIEAVL